MNIHFSLSILKKNTIIVNYEKNIDFYFLSIINGIIIGTIILYVIKLSDGHYTDNYILYASSYNLYFHAYTME